VQKYDSYELVTMISPVDGEPHCDICQAVVQV
jgi:hypothetical protein